MVVEREYYVKLSEIGKENKIAKIVMLISDNKSLEKYNVKENIYRKNMNENTDKIYLFIGLTFSFR